MARKFKSRRAAPKRRATKRRSRAPAGRRAGNSRRGQTIKIVVEAPAGNMGNAGQPLSKRKIF